MTFTTPETPAGTKVRETLGKRRCGVLTGESRIYRNYFQHLVDFGDRRAYCTFLVIVTDDE